MPEYAPGEALAGTTSFIATLRVCLEFSAPPVVSPTKPTLAMKGPIAPLVAKETLSAARAEDVTRKTSDQLVVEPTRAAPKLQQERSPCLSSEAMMADCGQPEGE